jgi:phenylpropionate dioxygenase-like ring-hydroxylating dioxygenase large terminal subunit
LAGNYYGVAYRAEPPALTIRKKVDSVNHLVEASYHIDKAGEARMYEAMRHFWHPVMYASGLGEQPVAVTLLGEQLVVARMAGAPRCFLDLCPHRGTALSLGQVEGGDQLRCPYHGWTYGPDGVCTSIPSRFGAVIPSRARTRAFPVQEKNGLIWVALVDDPRLPVPDFPQFSDPAFRTIEVPVYEWHTSAPRRIENYIDVSHLAWVHDGVLGDRNRPEVPDHEVTREDTRIRFVYAGQQESMAIGKNQGLGGGEETFVSALHYSLFIPSTVLIEQPMPDGHTYALFFSVCPAGPTSLLNFTFMARDYNLDDVETNDRTMLDYNELVVTQDRPVVESQRPEQLPFDLSGELHIRGVDRASLEYRKWLIELTNSLVP